MRCSFFLVLFKNKLFVSFYNKTRMFSDCVLLSIRASIESAKLSLLVCSGDLRAKSGNCKPLATSLKSNHRQLQYISRQHRTLKPRGKKENTNVTLSFYCNGRAITAYEWMFSYKFLKTFFFLFSFLVGGEQIQ